MALIDRLIWQIEAHLDAPLTLPLLADRCAVSQHHMCRAFQLATGLSIMAYIRARRLTEAARTIAGGKADLLQVALDAGYGSHEAFTRAFAAYSGILPSALKKARDLSTLTLMEPLEMKKDMIIDIARPAIRDRDAFRVVGYALACRNMDISAIPGLWRRFNAWEAENGQADTAYGVSYDHGTDGDFRYLAGMEMPALPEGLEAVEIPASRYAVFTHDGSIGDLPRTIYTIWNKALPDAGLDPATGPEFEVYDSRFDPITGRGIVEVWIPLA